MSEASLPAPETKLGAALSFEGGSLALQRSGYGDGNGAGVFAFAEDGIEPVREFDDDGRPWDGYLAKLPATEILAIRDWLNEWLPPPPLTVWQPMNTAPKDGTDILVWKAGHHVMLARWTGLGRYGGPRWYTSWYNTPLPEDPTLWTPVPAAPDRTAAPAVREALLSSVLLEALKGLVEHSRPSNWDEVDSDYPVTTAASRDAWLAACAAIAQAEAA